MSTLNYSDTQNLTFEYLGESFVNKVQLSLLILLMFIIILTILGNTLVLVATWREKSLHQPNKYFIACLAIADLLIGMVSVPIDFYQRFNQHPEGGYVLIPALCHFHKWVDAFAATASIYTLTFISFDRYLKISKPLHYKSRMTTSRSLKVIFITFLISIVYATFSIVSKECYTFDKGYYTFLAVAAFFAPIIIMMITYVLIFLVAHKRQKMLRNGELGQTFNGRYQRTALLQDLKIIRMMVIVVGVFIICWGPFFIWLMLTFYKLELFYRMDIKLEFIIRKVVGVLPLINSLCNPIIYACLDQKYKEAFKHLFQKLMRRPVSRRQEPSNAIELRNLNQPTI